MYIKRKIWLYLLILFFSFNVFALTIPFISKKYKEKTVSNIQVTINGISYNLDTSNTPCKKIKIQNWRLNCIVDINSEEVVIPWIVLPDTIDIVWNTFNSDISYTISVNDETYFNKFKHVLFSVYSWFSYLLDWYLPSSFVTKKDFEDKLNEIEEKINELKRNYVNIKELSMFPLNNENKYCDISSDTTGTCKYTKLQFLKKDPITWKINLSLLINYSE